MLEAVGVILSALLGSSLFKKHPYCIWIRKATGAWECPNPTGNSARRCRIAVKGLVEMGIPALSIVILPKGIIPPK